LWHDATYLTLNLLLLLLNLQEQSAVDVWKYTSKSDGGADKGIEFFVTADGELEVAGGDTLDLEILGGVLFQNYQQSVN
jgi:hypothetical protein